MSKLKLFVVAHTHFDAEVFVPRDETLEWGSRNILEVLYLLDRDPDFRYVLDQRCYVEGFAGLYPEQMARMKAHVASGRLEMAGDMHAMPDSNIPSGESYVRQIQYGRQYFEHEFGRRSRIGWMLDSFGHHPQLPQIMRKAGFDVYAMQRGPTPDSKAAFQWAGIDGTRLRCEWMPHTYALISNAPGNLPAFTLMIERIKMLIEPYAYNNQFIALSGMDISAPEQHLPEMVRQYNAAQHDVELVMATPSEYFAAQPAEGLPEYAGDLNPVFTGCYAARISVKQRNREVEQKLIAAETLQAINWAECSTPADAMETAWEPVLFNQFHDIICGSHLDATYESAIERYKIAGDQADAVTRRALNTLAAQIDTRGEGIPLLVVNTLAHARKDVARVTLGLAHERWESLALFDHEGTPVPLQLENVQRHPDGSIKCADLIFIAEMPSLGYRTYFVRSGEGVPAPQTDLAVSLTGSGYAGMITGQLTPDEGWMRNSLIDVRASIRTGSIQSLVLRDMNWDVVARHEHGFAAVCRQEDQGDPWEYYGPLRGAATSQEPLVDPVPPRGQALFTDQYGGQGWGAGGPVMAELGMQGPFSDGRFARRIRLYAGLPRVDLITELTNQQRFVRYRNVFPLNVQQPRITYEIPFGALVRPEGEYPAQNWVDVCNGEGERGVALLNRGIPGHSLVGNVLTASLMKCVKVVSYDAGGYSARTRDELGFEIGLKHRFEQALLPHAGNWQRVQLVHEGMAFNAPLIVHKPEVHEGKLPAMGSFVQCTIDHAAVHAVVVEGHQIVLRVVESAGNSGAGKISTRWPLRSVIETDLAGDPIATLSHDDAGFAFELKPFEIKTFRMETR